MLHYYQNGAKGEETVSSSLRKAKFLFKVSMMFSDFKNTLVSQISRSTIENWYRKSRRSKSRLRSQVLYAAENSSSLTVSLQHWVFLIISIVSFSKSSFEVSLINNYITTKYNYIVFYAKSQQKSVRKCGVKAFGFGVFLFISFDFKSFFIIRKFL